MEQIVSLICKQLCEGQHHCNQHLNAISELAALSAVNPAYDAWFSEQNLPGVTLKIKSCLPGYIINKPDETQCWCFDSFFSCALTFESFGLFFNNL